MSKKRTKVLVTGSGGFIFGNCIRRMFYTKQSYEIVSIDRVRRSNVMQNVYLNKDHTFYIADVTDAHTVNIIFETAFKDGPPDIVIHGAAESFVDSSIKDARPFITSNVLGTQVVIDACVRWGVKRLIYVSTDEVYGHLESEESPPWNEDAPLAPRNPYSASKAAGELLVQAAHETHGLTYNITRSCNNYGPWQDPEKFIPKILQCVVRQNEVPVYGQGSQVRDWVHVHDKCDAIIKIVNEGKDNEVYNISAGQEFSNLEVFHIICDLLNSGHDLLKFVKDRPGHDFRYSVDSTKLRQLGWEPQYKFRDGIAQTIDWYMKNQFLLNPLANMLKSTNKIV